MIDVNALKGQIVKKGMTQYTVAQKLGMAPQTFYRKMNKGVFGSDEIEAMIDILDIDDPIKIFFTEQVT